MELVILLEPRIRNVSSAQDQLKKNKKLLADDFRQKYASSQQKIQLENLKPSRGLGLRFLRIRPDSQI